MIRRAFHKALSLFERRERFLVIDVFDDAVQASLFRVSFEHKRIEFVRFERVPCGTPTHSNRFSALEKLLRRFGSFAQYQVIMSVDPSFVTTVHSSLTIVREQPSREIDEGDLDNLIGQGIWKSFDRHRGRAARKMGVPDFDVLLADARIKRIRVDGHKVLNPVGFRAKTVELDLVHTVSSRRFFGELRERLPRLRPVFIGENGVLYASLIAKLVSSPEFLFVNLFRARTDLVCAEQDALYSAESFPWGEKDFLDAVAHALGVGDAVADRLVQSFSAGEGSPLFLRQFERLLRNEFETMVRGITAQPCAGRAKKMYLNPSFPLPPFVFTPSFARHFHRRVELFLVPAEFFRNPFGFEVRVRASSVPHNLFSAVAPILEFCFLPRNDKIDAMVARHTRWLLVA